MLWLKLAKDGKIPLLLFLFIFFLYISICLHYLLYIKFVAGTKAWNVCIYIDFFALHLEMHAQKIWIWFNSS